MNISIMRRIDRYVGVGIIRAQALFRKKQLPPKAPKRILIIKLFGFGNFIFLSPVLKNLRRIFPQAKVDVLTFRPNREICEMYSEYIDGLHTLDFSTRKLGFEMVAFAARNWKKYDIVLDFEQFVRLSAIIGRMIEPKYMVGLATRNSLKEAAFDKAIFYKEDKHVVDEFYSVAEQLAFLYHKKIDSIPALVPPGFAETRKVKSMLRGLRGKMLVGVCPGGRADDVERRYPKEMLAEALDKLASSNQSLALVFFGAKSEREEIEYIISHISRKSACTDAAGLSLPESAALISRMRLFVSNDTGPIHLAASLGVFCIGLYGPSKEWIYGPFTESKVILRDERHKPIRSNHNEKNVGWPATWWPSPARVASAISSSTKKLGLRADGKR